METDLSSTLCRPAWACRADHQLKNPEGLQMHEAELGCQTKPFEKNFSNKLGKFNRPDRRTQSESEG